MNPFVNRPQGGNVTFPFLWFGAGVMPISCQSMTVTAYASCEIDGMNFVGLDTLSHFPFTATAYGARFTNITLNMEIPVHTALVVSIPILSNI